MCSVPDGYGSISRTYDLFDLSARSSFETLKARASSQARCHFSSIDFASYLSIGKRSLETEKPLGWRGQGKPSRRRRGGSLRYVSSSSCMCGEDSRRDHANPGQNRSIVLDLFPDSAAIDNSGELTLGGI